MTRLGFIFALVLPFAEAQQPVTYRPALLQSGSPVVFTVAAPRAAAILGTWLNRPVRFTRSPAGRWFLLAGIDVEQAPGTYTLELTETLTGGETVHVSAPVTVSAAHYRTSTIQVPDRFLAPDVSTQAEIAANKLVKDAAFARIAPEPLWFGSFARPVDSASTDSFGTRRTFNGTLASIHKGADFRAAAGTPVYAANDGVVSVAQPMFYEGNFVVVDHGMGLQTLYMHFSRIDVHAGEHVVKGQRLGLSGATGRVTGPHLHFAVRWQGAYLDPIKLLALAL